MITKRPVFRLLICANRWANRVNFCQHGRVQPKSAVRYSSSGRRLHFPPCAFRLKVTDLEIQLNSNIRPSARKKDLNVIFDWTLAGISEEKSSEACAEFFFSFIGYNMDAENWNKRQKNNSRRCGCGSACCSRRLTDLPSEHRAVQREIE